jgi:RNA-binding protein YlmH
MQTDPHLIDRLKDLSRQASDRGFLTHTGFLTPAEQAEAGIWLKKNKADYQMNGGYAGAERQICFLLPDYLAGTQLAEADLSETIGVLNLETASRSATLSHRDYLGSLLGLGIRRDQLGDILVREHGATVLLLTSLAPFVETQLERVGSLPVKIETIALAAIVPSVRSATTLRITVASRRLDKVAACGFGLSRADMAEMIRSGSVQVNWREEQRPDQEIPIGAVISLRGHGRICLLREEGLSRKDRQILIIEKYL